MKHAIEAILLATGEPQTFAALAKHLDTDTDSIARAVAELIASMDDHGIMVTELDGVVSLVTRAEHSALIESIRKDELSKELSKASAETLAVVAYRPGVSKSQIEFIRGVNASYSLRSLQMRGLIETKGSGRSIGYHPTSDLLHHFGIAQLSELPAYAETTAKLDALISRTDETQ